MLGLAENRARAVDFGTRLQYHGFIDHVVRDDASQGVDLPSMIALQTKEHDFKDAYLFFRFYFDELDV